MKYTFYLFCVLFLIGCNRNPGTENSQSRKMIGVYEGILPCADCSGLKTELTLYSKKSPDSYEYTLIETYLNTRDGDRMYKKSGKYKIEHDNTSDKTAVIYVLNPDSVHRLKYWLQNDSIIAEVDEKGDIIDTTMNFSLKRK